MYTHIVCNDAQNVVAKHLWQGYVMDAGCFTAKQENTTA